MFITKDEQNETLGPIFQIVITEYQQNETLDTLDFKCV